jgi:hypothetical protein
MVTGRTKQRRLDLARHPEAQLLGVGARLVHGGPPDGRIADNPFAHGFAAGLELRLDQGHNLTIWRQLLLNTPQDPCQRDERDVDDGQADALRQSQGIAVVRIETAGVRPLHRNYASVTTQRLGELSASHVESIDARRTALQQHIGESTGRCAYIETDTAGRVDLEGVQSGGELLATTRHVPGSRDEVNRCRVIDHVARFAIAPCLVPGTDRDLPGEQQCLRFGACLGQAAFDEQLVEPDPLSGMLAGQAVRASRLAREGLSASISIASRTWALMPGVSMRRTRRRSAADA